MFALQIHAATLKAIKAGSSMTTLEKGSAGTTYYDRDSRQRHAGLSTAASVMCMWTVASYDYSLAGTESPATVLPQHGGRHCADARRSA